MNLFHVFYHYTMGGELDAKLFIGPVEEHTVKDWIFILGINTIENVIEQMKEVYKDYYDDDYYTCELYESSSELQEDVDKMFKKLDELGLRLVLQHNCEDTLFKIGCIADTDSLSIDNCKIEQSREIWKKYNITKLHVFAGMIGDFPISYY